MSSQTLCPVAKLTPARKFEEHGLSYEQWKSVLHLSTRWGFASLRNLALRSIKLPTAFDQLLLARTYDVDHWVLPALSALCERTIPISLKDARQMGIEDVVVVATVREEIRSQRSFVDTAGIKRRIKATQARMVAHAASDGVAPDDTPVSSESEAAEKGPPMEPVTGIGARTDNYKVTTGVTKAIPSKVDSYNVREEAAVAIPSKIGNYSVAEEVGVAIPSKVNSYNAAEGVVVATPSKVHSYSVAEDVAVAASEAVDTPGGDEKLVSPCVSGL